MHLPSPTESSQEADKFNLAVFLQKALNHAYETHSFNLLVIVMTQFYSLQCKSWLL